MFEIDWQFFFKNLLLLYKPNILWLKCEKGGKPQINFRAPLIQKIKIFNILFTYNLLKCYKIYCELCLNFNEYNWTFFKHVNFILKFNKVEENIHINHWTK
jgi:hypothetical protein